MGFRGDIGLVSKWEPRVGGVSLTPGNEIEIDPSTYLRTAKRDTIRKRYAFILTPDESEALLSVVGLRGTAAVDAWRANPILQRVRLQSFDVAALVPEVAEPVWKALVNRIPRF